MNFNQNIEEFFKKRKSQKREQLIKQQNRLEELNLLVSYEILEDGENGEKSSTVYLSDIPNVMPSEELYSDAMTKLVKLLEEDNNIKNIKKIFTVNNGTIDIFKKLGFTVFPISKATALAHRMLTMNYDKSYEQKYAIALINRENFLERFDSESAVK